MIGSRGRIGEVTTRRTGANARNGSNVGCKGGCCICIDALIGTVKFKFHRFGSSKGFDRRGSAIIAQAIASPVIFVVVVRTIVSFHDNAIHVFYDDGNPFGRLSEDVDGGW